MPGFENGRWWSWVFREIYCIASWNWVFPEYGSLFPKLEGETSLTILKHYTTHEQILRAGPKSLSAAIHQASHGKLSAAFSQRLMEAASSTIELQEGIEAAAFAIRNIAASVERIQEEIATIEKELTKVLAQIPYVPQLLSIPGVGKITLALLLGEAGDLRRYHKAEGLIKLAGLNLFEIDSGSHQGRRHISKRGRPLLRKIPLLCRLADRQDGRGLPSYLCSTHTGQPNAEDQSLGGHFPEASHAPLCLGEE